MKMGVRNYSIIIGRDWQALMGGYYSMDGSHFIIPKGPKTLLYIVKNVPFPILKTFHNLR
jgi:hypothetical protein